jgi:hypothetical protein
MHDMAERGVLPRFYVRDEVERGELEILLPGYRLPSGDVFALHGYAPNDSALE